MHNQYEVFCVPTLKSYLYVLYMTTVGSSSSTVMLNYKFQQPDTRDFKVQLTATNLKASNTVTSFSIQTNVKTVYDQGQLGSCVSNAFAGYINMCTTNRVFISRLLHYYCGRAIQGTSSIDDTGLDIRQAAKIIQQYGACAETMWPYIISQFSVLPPISAFRNSLFFQKYTYSFINQDITTLTSFLYTQKLPILFGFRVYSSFMTGAVASTGVVPMPNVAHETLEGGHCVVMVGFNNTTSRFTCVNSWGASWGNKGFFTIPYAYVSNPALASDFCCLNFIY